MFKKKKWPLRFEILHFLLFHECVNKRTWPICYVSFVNIAYVIYIGAGIFAYIAY